MADAEEKAKAEKLAAAKKRVRVPFSDLVGARELVMGVLTRWTVGGGVEKEEQEKAWREERR
jgi:hypothetical protein